MKLETLFARGRPLLVALLLVAPFGLVLERARAGDGHYYPPVADKTVAEECGSCHLAYPPALLPARSWQKIMAGLENHFGDDASVTPEVARHIEAYLTANAADRGGQAYTGKLLRGVDGGQTPLRITELPRWVREHREVPAADWRSPEVRSKANCAACHRDAARGFFED